MLSQDMIDKFPAAYQKLARQHDSAELNLIMEMAKLYYERLLLPLEVGAVPEPTANIVIPPIQPFNCLNNWCGKGRGHNGACEQLD